LGSGICKKNTQLLRRKFINMLLYIIGVILFAGIFAAYVQSPQYIELVKAQRWNGVLPVVSGGGSGMILQLKQP
jgi:hypothetical protein